jgi:hypothetical protein
MSEKEEFGSAEQGLMKIDVKINQIVSSIAVMGEKQAEMAEDISEIKKAVYHPDEGLYARIRALETWKLTSTKMMWILFTSFAGTIGAMLLSKISFN